MLFAHPCHNYLGALLTIKEFVLEENNFSEYMNVLPLFVFAICYLCVSAVSLSQPTLQFTP